MADPSVDDLLELMAATDPADWPSPRGYGYSGPTGKKLKSWHTFVVEEFRDRLTEEGRECAKPSSD